MYFFGINTVAISIVRGIVASLTLTILYLIGKELGANSYYSYLFALLSFVDKLKSQLFNNLIS